MVSVGKGNFFQNSHVAIGIGRMWGQEAFLQLVLQQHVVLRRKAKACSEKEKEVNLCHSKQHKNCTIFTLGKETKVLSIPHDVFYAGPLAKESIYDWGP